MLSKAKSSTPSAWASAISASRLMVLPKESRVRGNAERVAAGELALAGDIEAGAERGERRHHLGRRIGLHRIEDRGLGKERLKHAISGADDIEIDDDAGRRRALLGKEPVDPGARAHGH